MINSMTGFARHEGFCAGVNLLVEIKSVNNKGLNVALNLPDRLQDQEQALVALVQKNVSRGRVNISIRYSQQENETQDDVCLLDKEALIKVLDAMVWLQQQADARGLKTSLDLTDVLKLQNALDKKIEFTPELYTYLTSLFVQTLELFNQSRYNEGQGLKTLILDRLSEISANLDIIKTEIVGVFANERQKLLTKLNDLKIEVDPTRFEAEMVYIINRSDIAEEVDRLNLHLKTCRDILHKGGACGRRLDFMCQELNREANTIASKSINQKITQIAVDIKVLIEQIREQVQNIE